MIKRFYILLLAIVASVGMNAKDPELPGAFSINANGDKIVFSRGNLQATTTDLGANWTWDFAPNQWSFIGDAVANTSLNGNKTVSTNGTVDLFGWSTAATYYGIHNSNSKADYSGDFVDWGNTMTGEWRTLSKAEWRYIIYDRKNAYQKRSQATVNGVQGYVLLPDTWTLPSGLSFTNNTNNYTTNQYEGTDWDAMENAGAVFLPAGGDRTKASVYLYGYGWYWASTPNDEDGGKAYYFYFYETSIGITEYNRSDGRSVRLVTAAPVPAYEAVMNLIDAIPATIEKTDACKNAIEAARAAYDALSTADKALVTNYSTLTAAEAAWAALPLGKWDSGDCEVILSQGGIMTVSKKAGEGNGAMDNYAKNSEQPWKDYRANVNSLVIESGVTELGSYAFYGLTYLEGDMVIPEGVTALHENTFYGNYKLTSVTLPSTTTLLGDKYNAFYGCVNVTDVYLPANPVNLVWNEDNDDFILEVPKSTICHVPADCLDGYIAKFDKTVNVTFVGDQTDVLTEAQRNAINGVKGLIAAIPSPVVYDEACTNAITAARSAYDALDTDLTLFIGNYQTLLDAEDAYAKAKADAEAVAAVIAKINAIPNPVTAKLSTKNAIDAARAAYDALTDEQKALVTNYARLSEAENEWESIVPSGGGKGSFSINASGNKIIFAPGNLQATYTTEGEGPIQYVTVTWSFAAHQWDYIGNAVGNTSVKENGLLSEDGTVDLFGWVGASSSWEYEKQYGITSSTATNAVDGYGNNSNDVLKRDWCVLANEANLANRNDWRSITKDEWVYLFQTRKNSATLFGLGSVNGVNGMILLPDNWKTPAGATFVASTTKGLVDKGTYFLNNNNDNFTHNTYTLEQWAVMETAGAVFLPAAGYRSGATVKDTEVIGSYWSSTAHDSWRADPLRFTESVVWPQYNDYRSNGQSVRLIAPSTDSPVDEAQAAVDLINAIPTPVEYTDACEAAIDAARNAIEALDPEVAALIDDADIARLTQAENEYATMKADHEAAEAVEAKIDAIPSPIAYNAKCKAAIESARIAYNVLTETQQALVDPAKLAALTAAEAAYQTAKQDGVDFAIGKIDAIPSTIAYNTDCKEAIEDARATYNALDDEQKTMVPTEELKKLTDAETAYAALAAEIEYNVQFLGKSQSVLYEETIALTKLPNGAPEVNGFAFDHWEVLPTPMAAGLHLQAIYRSLITVDPVAFDTLMYNGIAQNLIKAGEAEEGHLEYRIGEGTWGTALPQATNAGSYAIQYKLVRDGKPDYIAPVILTADIAKAPVSYVAPVAYDTLVYNAADQTLIEAGKTNDGTFEYSLDPQTLDSWNTELPKVLGAGSYNVYYRVMGDQNHLDSIASTPVAVAIDKAALTATADDKTVTYGDAVPEYSVTYAGWQGADGESVLTGTIAFACEYAPTSNVGEYAIVPSGVDAANYSIQFVNGKVTVNQAALTITAEDKTVTYGDAIPTYTAKYEGWKNQDNESVVSGLTYTCEYAPTSNVGDYTIVPSGATALNYNISYTNGKVTVNQAALTITADDKEVEYGEQAPEFTASYEGWKNGDDASVVSGLKYTCDYLVTSNVGDYTIIPSDATAMNYSISFVNGTLKVNQAPLMITADDKTVIYGDAVPEYTPSYEGWKNNDGEEVLSGLTFTCEYAPTSNIGEYPIVPSGATATNYAISYTNGKVTVNQAALTITADDKSMIYGDEHPEFTASYEGWKNNDDESVVSGLAYTCSYAPGSYIGTYAIEPNSATALNYEITFVNGTLTVNRAVVTVSDAEAQIAKFADGHAGAVVLNNGKLNGIKLNDPISHITTATFSSAEVREHLTITLFYELTGDAALLNNYDLQPTSEIFTTEGVIIEPFIPDEDHKPGEGEQIDVKEGIDVYAYGYCDGNGYSLKYHLNSGNPDQYKIDFADSRFYNVDWTDLVNAGKDGTIEIDIPDDVPTGDYSMTVYFRDSRFPWLESRALTVTFHVNIPETYVTPLFENIIALVDTCNCFTDIQWYYRANDGEPWNPIEGATGFYHRVNGKLTGQYFVSAKMNGEHTYTCGQTDMETLYGADKPPVVTVRAFPNPVITTTTVTIENSESNEHDLRIVNLKGVEMFNTKFQGNKTVVDMNGYLQGYYMISVDGVTVKVLKK